MDSVSVTSPLVTDLNQKSRKSQQIEQVCRSLRYGRRRAGKCEVELAGVC